MTKIVYDPGDNPITGLFICEHLWEGEKLSIYYNLDCVWRVKLGGVICR